METEPRFPGGVLTASQYVPPPTHSPLSWNIYREDLEGPGTFMEQILQQVNAGRSFTCIGSPGVGKTYALEKVYNTLQEIGEKVICLGPTHCSARLLPEGKTIHYFISKYGRNMSWKGWNVTICAGPEVAKK